MKYHRYQPVPQEKRTSKSKFRIFRINGFPLNLNAKNTLLAPTPIHSYYLVLMIFISSWMILWRWFNLWRVPDILPEYATRSLDWNSNWLVFLTFWMSGLNVNRLGYIWKVSLHRKISKISYLSKMICFRKLISFGTRC